MHECFANHDIRVFRDPYLSSTGESLTAAIAKKLNKKLDILRTITEIKDISLPFETWKGLI